MSRVIEVVDYDPVWLAAFEKEAAILNAIFSHRVIEVHHIGSTAVPGLDAKPIIDILVVLDHTDDVNSFDRAMEDELAVRAALGAGRWRLLRHSFTESILVALIGGIISLVVAFGAIRFISVRMFTDLPGASVQLDYKVFGFALLCSLLTGVLFGTLPAWLASRADLNLALRENSRGSSAGRSQHRTRHMLVVGEVAFAMVLLAAAGLFLRGVQRFLNADPGWQVDGLVTAHMGLQGEKYASDQQRVVFLTELENRLRALPGVQHVAIGESHPVFGYGSSNSFLIEGRPEPPPDNYPEMFFESVSNNYFETLGARLQQGRTFNSADTADHPRVVIINEATARNFWPNESPIGKRIISTFAQKDFYEIVGVVNDLAFPGSLGEPYTRFEAFVPVTQAPPSYLTLIIRTGSNSEAIANSLRSPQMRRAWQGWMERVWYRFFN